MKRFIVNIFVLSTILLFVSVCIELLLYLKPNVYSYKRKYIEVHLNEIETLILGNSHIEFALKPELLGRHCFNFASAGRSTIYDVELAKRYIPQMKRLQVVIMPIDYTAFSFGREKTDLPPQNDRNLENTYKCMYYKYMGLRVDGFWFWSEILNSKLNYMGRFIQSKEEARECDSLGYIKRDIRQRGFNWQNTALPPLIDTSMKIDKEKQTLLYQQYLTLAKLTHDKGCRLVLLGTPMYKTYQKIMNKRVCQERTLFVHQLQNECNNVEYYDFTYDKHFMPNDFDDASHLVESGAIKFSKIINNILRHKKAHFLKQLCPNEDS